MHVVGAIEATPDLSLLPRLGGDIILSIARPTPDLPVLSPGGFTILNREYQSWDFAERSPMFFWVDEDDYRDLDELPSKYLQAGAEYPLKDPLIVVEVFEILIFTRQLRTEESERLAECERVENERMI